VLPVFLRIVDSCRPVTAAIKNLVADSNLANALIPACLTLAS